MCSTWAHTLPWADPSGNAKVQQRMEVPTLLRCGGSPVGAGDADSKTLTVLKHSSPLGPLPRSRIQPQGRCPEQMPASLQPLPPSTFCSWQTVACL